MIPSNVSNVSNTSTDAPNASIDSIDSLLISNKAKIKEILNHSYSNDDSLLFGTLSLLQSRCISYILHGFVNASKDDDSSSIQLAQNVNPSSPIMSSEEVIGRIWIDIHHPSIKYFQAQFLYANKDLSNRRDRRGRHSGSPSSSIVEIRKLFDHFVKFISRCREFYLTLLHDILRRYDLSIYIPVRKVCTTLKLDETEFISHSDCQTASDIVPKVVYVVHKCVLYIGDLSRYRAFIAKTYLPSTAISKEDNNNYSKSIELYKLSLLILPSLGDPYNHIAIIDNFKDDKFNVVYNFVRSSMTSSPLSVGFNNLINLLAKQPKQNSILHKFESHNALDRDTITKNDRMELLKSQFLVLLSYYLLPNKWKMKEGFLVKGYDIHGIETDFYHLLAKLDFHKQIFNDFYFKQLAILTGGFEILIDRRMAHLDLRQTPQSISSYLDFIFRYLLTLLKVLLLNLNKRSTTPNISTSLLPVTRLMLCWMKERELARYYLLQNLPCTNALAEIFNSAVIFFKENSGVLDEVDSGSYKELLTSGKLFEDRPSRRRLFKEDVTLKEFKPVNFYLSDFDDDHLYRKDETATLALIGELPNESHKSMKLNDNMLRLIAICCLAKKLVMQNTVGIVFSEDTGLFSLKYETDLCLESGTNSNVVKPISERATDGVIGGNEYSAERFRRRKPAVRSNTYRAQKQYEADITEGQGLEDSLFNAEARRTDTKGGVAQSGRFVDMVSSLVSKDSVSSEKQAPPVTGKQPLTNSGVDQPFNLLSRSIWSNQPAKSDSSAPIKVADSIHSSTSSNSPSIAPEASNQVPMKPMLFPQYNLNYLNGFNGLSVPTQVQPPMQQTNQTQPQEQPYMFNSGGMATPVMAPAMSPMDLNLNMNMAMSSLMLNTGSNLSGIPFNSFQQSSSDQAQRTRTQTQPQQNQQVLNEPVNATIRHNTHSLFRDEFGTNQGTGHQYSF
ncbi:hypothetical protein FOA43_002397 [Brettanomyces nanus]|uniref:Nonsense-mediated mRNA decay factor n=1 Tax=Eeniella nana TaxID=13502 RepID=A0A875RUY1_EENNA|nr:uncharacterized protein FOA43_002397 [Brettanomyces nanus]QPG75057.1 hypothetical protein FOA43_002397 [Brettanomyces nanus]